MGVEDNGGMNFDRHNNDPEYLKEYIEPMRGELADLRAELALCETTHANLNDEYHVLKKRLAEYEQRDEVWRAKKEMLENDLGEAWKRLEEAEGERDEIYDKLELKGDDRCPDGALGQLILNRNAIRLNREQLARYREGFRPIKEAWDKCKNYKSEDVVFKATEYEEAIEQAIKAVEGCEGGRG